VPPGYYPGSEPQYPAGYGQPVASAARFFLQCIETVFTENEVTLPTRRLIVVGSLAVEQNEVLAVMFGGIKIGSPGNELVNPRLEDSGRTAVYNVELWRKLPGGDSPVELHPETTSVAAEAAMQDSWLLFDAAHRADQLNVGVITSASVNANQGGMQGVSLQTEIQIP
jgi:hypothetical protein